MTGKDMQSIAADVDMTTPDNTDVTPVVENDGGSGDVGTTDTSSNGGTPSVSTQPTVSSDPNDPLTVLEGLTIDPTLKESLKQGVLRQSDYTRKTQELAEQRKQYEADLAEYQQYKPYLDKVLQDPKLYEQVFEGSPQNPNGQEGQPEYPEDPVEYANWVKQQTIEAIRTEQAQEADFQQAESLDPRLNSDAEFATTIAGLVAQDVSFLQGQKTATQATQDAIAKHEAYVKRITDSVRTEYRTEMQKKVQEKRMVVPQGGSPAPIGAGKPKSMLEAMHIAEEQLSS